MLVWPAAIETPSLNNSCRNRHSPKCQAPARQRWLTTREREVLPTNYFQVVFSVPQELNIFALENPHAFYDFCSRQVLLPAGASFTEQKQSSRQHHGN
jgi:hypothetical protein